MATARSFPRLIPAMVSFQRRLEWWSSCRCCYLSDKGTVTRTLIIVHNKPPKPTQVRSQVRNDAVDTGIGIHMGARGEHTRAHQNTRGPGAWVNSIRHSPCSADDSCASACAAVQTVVCWPAANLFRVGYLK